MNLGLCSDRPVTNHLSQGTALHMVMMNVLHKQLQIKISGHMSHVLMSFFESKIYNEALPDNYGNTLH